MTDATPGVAEALAAKRAIELFVPPTATAKIDRVNHLRPGLVEILNIRILHEDGSTVEAPRIVVDLGPVGG